MAWLNTKKLLSPVMIAGSVLSAKSTKSDGPVRSNRVMCFENVINDAKNKIMQKMVLANIPGSCCVVHVDGKPVMKAGFGYSDVENCTPFTCKTSMRIASISKVVSAMMALHLAQENKIDLDKNLLEFLKSHNLNMPLSVGDSEIDLMTVRHLLNHTSGVRHYDFSSVGGGDSAAKEFYSSKNYPTVLDGLQMFINDTLLFKPGSKFNYTTFGYSLLSFILEKSTEKTFSELLSDFAAKLGLHNTHLDNFEHIILNRSQYYCESKKGKLQNCPYVDSSCKWAGGGIVSTAEDIARLGDILLYLYQSDSPDNYINHKFISAMLDSNPVTEVELAGGVKTHYGLGITVKHELESHGEKIQYFQTSHTGGGVGACSVMLALPLGDKLSGGKPRGITVVLFCNQQSGGELIRLADEIAASFVEEIENQCSEKYYNFDQLQYNNSCMLNF